MPVHDPADGRVLDDGGPAPPHHLHDPHGDLLLSFSLSLSFSFATSSRYLGVFKESYAKLSLITFCHNASSLQKEKENLVDKTFTPPSPHALDLVPKWECLWLMAGR